MTEVSCQQKWPGSASWALTHPQVSCLGLHCSSWPGCRDICPVLGQSRKSRCQPRRPSCKLSWPRETLTPLPPTPSPITQAATRAVFPALFGAARGRPSLGSSTSRSAEQNKSMATVALLCLHISIYLSASNFSNILIFEWSLFQFSKISRICLSTLQFHSIAGYFEI